MQKVIPTDAVLIPPEAKKVFSGEIFDVYQWQQQMFDSSSSTFEMLKRPDTVVGLCVVNDRILVLDDEQPHTGSKKSLPSGRVEPSDNSIEAAAKRETLEETGYQFNNWRLIRVEQPHLKIEWFVYLWLAWEPTGQKKEAQPDAGEKLTLHELTLDELKQLVATKKGYLAEGLSFIGQLDSVDQLLDTPEYIGKVYKY